ncbi:MAG: nuclear transport factor 2 family protein [Deltaproteobacteria bacterium]|jgi:3-phenylpropionate/cinnamic acid dioxygenase small subunit|nr:nuclear transport factor 2 family protein [Deltaproteobacteria bacterium]MBW2498681.1 nuclear transport factor 2 family protein [Deltaproteobacteria bacterium]
MTTPTAEDLRQIHNLLADYGATVDEGRWAEHLELWTEDCELVVFGRAHHGREALDRFMRKAVRGKHVTATPHLEFEGDRAHSVADYVFYRSSDLELFTAGVYRDVFSRTPEGWRLARREIEIQLRKKE